MRGLLLTFVVLVAGCDSADDLRPIPDVMIVELVAPGLLQLETESYAFCGIPIYVDSQTGPQSVDVEVRGAERVSVSCDGLVAATWRIGIPEASPVDVSIRHQGQTDQYQIRYVAGGRQLDALKISTTRPGPR